MLSSKTWLWQWLAVGHLIQATQTQSDRPLVLMCKKGAHPVIQPTCLGPAPLAVLVSGICKDRVRQGMLEKHKPTGRFSSIWVVSLESPAGWDVFLTGSVSCEVWNPNCIACSRRGLLVPRSGRTYQDVTGWKSFLRWYISCSLTLESWVTAQFPGFRISSSFDLRNT